MKNKLYSYLINNNISIEKDVFEYGFEYFYSYIIYLLVIIPISVFNHFTVEIIIFIILYIPIRKNIGGFHLKNKYHCLILSIIVTLFVPILKKNMNMYFYFFTFIIVFNTILYIMYVPIDCKEKILSKAEKKYYKFMAILIHFIYFLITIVSYQFNVKILFETIYIIELISSFSIFLSLFQRKIRNI